ncbi:MAG: DUF4159 domain-containing protein [Prochloraceae cyanobacterium]|nr:DUF4159 domain-containing protein [Prochloraceae cyanobacterium]
MNQIFPPPAIDPFERLRATDGLLINAQRWRVTQEYHRQRQNFHFQSLHQPGIVTGLGVKIITERAAVPGEYKDGKSVQLQPGLAIDLLGNPIVVPQPQNVQIAVEPPQTEPLTVYLVVSYRDPEDLAIREGQEMMREQFRIDVKIEPPTDLEVEVCRLLLQPAQTLKLRQPADILSPGYGNLDFRYRRSATLRAKETVKIAQIKHEDPEHDRNFINLDYLLNGVNSLYPQLQGIEPVGLVNWTNPQLQEYDLLYLTGNNIALNYQELEVLKNYLATGGVLLIDLHPDAGAAIKYVAALAERELNSPLKTLPKRNYIRRQPFLFARLPLGGLQQPIKMAVGGGVVLVTGDLAAVWGLDDDLSLSREKIRAAQELGTNILHFAFMRRAIARLQGQV